MQVILELAKEKLTTEEIKNEMLLRTEGQGWTVWHTAAYWGKLDIMQVILELAKKKLTIEEIKNEILLRTDREGRTAWQLAAYEGTLDVQVI
jgi:ankyrin repeat protein